MAIHLVYAPPKVGKSAFLTYVALYSMEDRERIYNAKMVLNQMMDCGYPLQYYYQFPHYTFVNQEFFRVAKMRSLIKTHVINPFELALPNNKFETMFIPEYSTILIDEAQKYYNSRKEVSSYVCNWFETHGHAHYDIWLATQRPKMIDLRIRELITDFKFVEKLEFIATKKGVETVFTVIEHNDCYSVQKFIESGFKDPAGKRKQYSIATDIRKCYDAYCYRQAFYNGFHDTNLKLKLLNGESSNVLMNDYIVPKGFFE